MNWRKLVIFLVTVSVFGLDRWSKWLVQTTLGPFDVKPVIPGLLNIVNSQNSGVAFGLFAESALPYRAALLVAFSIGAIAILAILSWRADRTGRRTALGLALILGGALGNVFDRIRMGSVTDFLDVYLGQVHWYTFNVADSAICVGAGLLLLAMWKPSGAPVRAT